MSNLARSLGAQRSGSPRDQPYEEQAEVVHGSEGDKYGISGHQFEFACAVARAYCDGQDI